MLILMKKYEYQCCSCEYTFILLVLNVNCWGVSIGGLFEIMKEVEQRAMYNLNCTSLSHSSDHPDSIDFISCM